MALSSLATFRDVIQQNFMVLLISPCCFPLAEFIIMLGERNPTLDKFRAALAENGAEFPVSNTVSFKERFASSRCLYACSVVNKINHSSISSSFAKFACNFSKTIQNKVPCMITNLQSQSQSRAYLGQFQLGSKRYLNCTIVLHKTL